MLAIQPETSRALPGRQASPAPAAAREEEFAWLLAAGCQVLIDCLTGLLRQLEPNWPARFPLTDCRTVDGNALRSNVIYR